MRYLKRSAWAAVVAGFLGSSAPAFGQGGTITTSGGNPIGGSLGGLGTGTSGSLGGGGAGGGLGGSSLGGTALTTMEAAPNITAPTGTTGGVINASNFLSGYYANPYYQGIITNARSGAAPGGFGQALYGAGGGTGGGNIGFAGSQAGGTTAGRAGLTTAGGGLGGRTGGLGGAGTTGATGGILTPVAAQIAYPAVVRFPTAPVAAPQLQADISGMIARSAGTIANPAGVQVFTQGGNVLLRGVVRDEDEARLVEGMVRLTPGVRQIKNELTFPRP